MRVLELSLRNFRVFEEVDLELPARVIGIFGPNGAGKSTLMEAIAFALYGVDAARTKKQEIRTEGVLTDCAVRLAFEHGGKAYEVRRSLRGRAGTPEADLFGGDLALASGVSDVDAEIRRLLHMDLTVFRASVFAEQKQLDAFSDVTTGKRKEMALRLLGIRPVDVARKAAREEGRRSKASADQLAGAVADLAELEARLKEAKDAAREAKGRAKEAADRLKAAAARAKAARKAFEDADRVRQRVEQLTGLLASQSEQRDRFVADLERLAERVGRMEIELAERPALEEELAALGDAAGRLRDGERLAQARSLLMKAEAELAAAPALDLEAAEAAAAAGEEAARQADRTSAGARAVLDQAAHLAAEAEERLARAGDADPTEPCPTCGRPLGEDFTAYLRHCKQEATAARKGLREAEAGARSADATAKAATSGHGQARHEVDVARKAAAERSRLEQRAEELRAETATIAVPFEGEEPDLETLRAARDHAEELRQRLLQLAADEKHAGQGRQDLERLEASLSEVDAKLSGLVEEAERLSFEPQAHARLRDELRGAEDEREAAQAAERDASDATREAEKEVARLSGGLEEARATERRVGELRSESRHLERTAMLLDGFRDHLVARVGPELSREAEALFRDLTNREYDDLRIDDETLAIEIADGEAYHPVERFSGSETDLANLALRVAISIHLSQVSGADVGMLVLDEVLASLDVERKDLFVQAMGRLADRFHQLFVITHAEQVKDQFPASIEVRKVARRRSEALLA